MKFVICYCDGEICFLLFARGKARKEFGVEEGYPGCLGGCSPMEEG